MSLIFKVLLSLCLCFGFSGQISAQSSDYDLGYAEWPQTDPDPEYEHKFKTLTEDFLKVCAQIYIEEVSGDGQQYDYKTALLKSGFVKSGDGYSKRDPKADKSNYSIHAYVSRSSLHLPLTYQPERSERLDLLNGSQKEGFACAFKLSDKRPGKDSGSWWSSGVVASSEWMRFGEKYRARIKESDAPLAKQSSQFMIIDEKICHKASCPEGDSLVVGLVIPREIIDLIRSENPSSDMELYKVTENGLVLDLLGNEIGKRKSSGMLIDALGTNLGHIGVNGDIFDPNGVLVARAISVPDQVK